MYFSVVVMVGFLVRTLKNSDQQEKINYLQIFLIVFLTIIFFAFFEQRFFFLPLFINNYVNANILGFQVPTPWFNMINPLVVILTGTILSKHWLRKKTSNNKTTFFPKFYLAFSFLSLSFFIIAYGISINQKALPSVYIIFFYIFCSLGEIILIPASLSLISKLSKKTQKSFFIGVFYLTMAFAQPLAGYISLLVIVKGPIQEKIPVSYVSSFSTMGATILLVIILIFVFERIKPIHKIFKVEVNK